MAWCFPCLRDVLAVSDPVDSVGVSPRAVGIGVEFCRCLLEGAVAQPSFCPSFFSLVAGRGALVLASAMRVPHVLLVGGPGAVAGDARTVVPAFPSGGGTDGRFDVLACSPVALRLEVPGWVFPGVVVFFCALSSSNSLERFSIVLFRFSIIFSSSLYCS